MTEILQPIQQYNSEFKDKHRALTEEYFDKLLKESGVDVDENASLMHERSKTLHKLQAASKGVKKQKNLRGLLIFFIVVLFVAALVGAYIFYDFDGLTFLAIVLPIVAVCIAVALIVVIVKVINPKIKDGNAVVNELNVKVKEIEATAWKQMRPLNFKYDWNIPDKLIYRGSNVAESADSHHPRD